MKSIMVTLADYVDPKVWDWVGGFLKAAVPIVAAVFVSVVGVRNLGRQLRTGFYSDRLEAVRKKRAVARALRAEISFLGEVLSISGGPTSEVAKLMVFPEVVADIGRLQRDVAASVVRFYGFYSAYYAVGETSKVTTPVEMALMAKDAVAKLDTFLTKTKPETDRMFARAEGRKNRER